MSLIRNERTKLMATYFSGLGVAAAAIGGIGQVVNTSTVPVWSLAAWIALSLALHSIGQIVLRRLRE